MAVHQNVSGPDKHDAPDSGQNNPVKVGGVATAANPAAVGEGDVVQASYTLTGAARVAVSGDAPSSSGLSTFATPETVDANGEHLLKSSAGVLYKVSIILTTSPAADRWLMVVNKATAAANGDDPAWRIYLPASNGDGLMADYDWGVYGLPLSSGIALALSSTGDDVTLVASEAYFQAMYV